MNFRGVFLFVILISLIIPLVSADTNQTSERVSKAYQCLENSVNNKTSSQLSFQESAFSILALGNNDNPPAPGPEFVCAFGKNLLKDTFNISDVGACR